MYILCQYKLIETQPVETTTTTTTTKKYKLAFHFFFLPFCVDSLSLNVLKDNVTSAAPAGLRLGAHFISSWLQTEKHAFNLL